jgi:hypothetical protein
MIVFSERWERLLRSFGIDFPVPMIALGSRSINIGAERSERVLICRWGAFHLSMTHEESDFVIW